MNCESALKGAIAAFVCAAVLTGGVGAGAQDPTLGRIEFPTSGSPAAQKLFLRGVLLLHSFEYDDAREQFQAAEKAEPGFAMAYWGEAMTHNHPIWMEQDRDAARKALERLAPTAGARAAKAPTAREKDYLRAVEILYGEGEKNARDGAYAEEMSRLSAKYPDDDEAAAFHALSLLGTCHQGRDFSVYMRAAGILEQVYQKNPEHPGAVHYLIHCYDDPVHAPLGLRPARVYAWIAAAAGHAQHMPSHIFLALGMWNETAASNEAAWKVSLERVERKSLGPDDRNYHALYWLEYAYLQQGRFADARGLLAEIEKDAGKTGSARARTHFSWMRAAAIVEGAIPPPADAVAGAGVSRTAEWLARGLAAWRRGDLESARRALREMDDAPGEADHAHGAAPAYSGDAGAAEVMRRELEGVLALAIQKDDSGIAVLKRATEAEDRLSLEFGPPEIVKPSHELLAEVLFRGGRAKEACAEFEKALARAPGRALSLRGLETAARRAGLEDLARSAHARYQRVRVVREDGQSID